RSEFDRQCKQCAEALNDRESQSKTRALVALRFAEPIEFAEDVLALVFGDSRPGIPNLDTQLLAPLAAGNDNAAARGVPHRIGHQVEEDSFQKDKVAPHPGIAWQHPK